MKLTTKLLKKIIREEVDRLKETAYNKAKEIGEKHGINDWKSIDFDKHAAAAKHALNILSKFGYFKSDNKGVARWVNELNLMNGVYKIYVHPDKFSEVVNKIEAEAPSIARFMTVTYYEEKKL